MTAPMTLEGRTALITGGAGGIGRAIAQSLAQRRCNLALADIDAASLAETARALAATGVRVSTHVLDVADAAAIAALPPLVLASHPGLELLFNNAGVALGGRFEELAERDFDWLLAVNLQGVVRMTRAFLPLLRQSGEARLVNVSSLFGLIAPPGQSAYAASKFAVRGFSEALRHELAGSNVGVTVVHPGGVNTSIARNARIHAAASAVEIERSRALFQRALTLPPQVAGEIIVRAVQRRRSRIIVGRDARIAAALERLAPVSYWGLLERISKSQARRPKRAPAFEQN
ncbi:SDR family NAD(P)-dependent oxidoreductase [Lichenicoccus sp.]|uniref:SDR family NAD(P)-dependent oxidoreductase n=1 Tax=Lichenicoccus sp. TaxID=2781899 RepID=UPI003D0E66E9